LSQAIKELAALPKGSRAIVSICADGGLGTVALLENLTDVDAVAAEFPDSAFV
jgi:hypothetical protein